MTSPITITSYNLHKGMSAFNRKSQIHHMATALQGLNTDILFLQEVQGKNLQHYAKIPDFPLQAHDKIISEHLSFYGSYGKNAIYPKKHHGNAILSRFPILTHHNLNISVNKFEQRGVLHCEILPNNWEKPLTCLCVHLNLLEPDRLKQYKTIIHYVNQHINPRNPLIIAGDFNDWRYKSVDFLGNHLNLQEVFLNTTGQYPKTFPSFLPILSLDRIYVRNLDILTAHIHHDNIWQKLSDHLPLSVSILPKYTI